MALATVVGLQVSEIRSRLLRMYEDGALLGVRAVVKPSVSADDSLRIFCGITLDSSFLVARGRFEAKAKEAIEVVSCYRVAADFDYLIQVVVLEMVQFRQLMAKLPHIEKFKVLTIIDSMC